MSNFYPKEFKEAISNLPSKEKDKLILRLLKKDLVLANRLLFELVNTDTVDQQRKIVQNRIKNQIQRATDTFYSPGYLNLDVRYMSGEINEHVSITKDKFGEAFLNLWMIVNVLKQNNKNILASNYQKARKFCVAVIARAFKILILIDKLHDDYFMDFQQLLLEFGNQISENKYLMDTAIKNGFDVNWLLNADIPENIVAIHREIRAHGFLK